MRQYPGILLLFATVCFLTASVASDAQAQPATGAAKPTIWDGVYTDTQALAGKSVYEAECASCHGADLNGGRARGLKGEAFLRDWAAGSVGRLYERVKTLMPRNAPASLSDEAYLNVLAHIFKSNEFPTGRTALAFDQLEGIMIYGKGGVDDIPNFALVGVVGCLTQGPDKTWVVTHASKPVMTRDPAVSKDTASAEALPLGDQTYVVDDIYPTPAGQLGRKVEAKGFLMRMPDKSTKISATSVQAVGASCGQ
jgi:cytochrome c5